MSFHSYQFFCVILPVLYGGYLLAYRALGWTGAFRFLAIASLAYYSAWSLMLVGVLIASVVANYLIGDQILRNRDDRRRSGLLLAVGLGGNVLALCYLKYANFLLDIAGSVAQQDYGHISLLVPVGMSFYTFVQIGYLVDAHAGQVDKQEFWHYVLFATFLPCVTAGPLVQQREMFDQMKGRRDRAFNPVTLAAGVTMFAMGLFKKVVFADQLQPVSDAVFNGVALGQSASFATAWVGSICYSLQLYFDFSGYSDMALGIGCIFGLRLPLNFDSPFKATNISAFWRRWHMTMTRFFTTYVYTPLAVRGMRSMIGTNTGSFKRYVKTAAYPVIVTFLIAGLWHGAGWTFIVYGLIHGVAIAIYLGWSRLAVRSMPAWAGWLLTMSVVVSALVVFRAPNLVTAAKLLVSMWSFGAVTSAGAGLAAVVIDTKIAAAMSVVLGAIVLLMPNSQQILHKYQVTSDVLTSDDAIEAGLLAWRPTYGGSIAIGLLLCIAIGSIGAGSAFLYYQF